MTQNHFFQVSTLIQSLKKNQSQHAQDKERKRSADTWVDVLTLGYLMDILHVRKCSQQDKSPQLAHRLLRFKSYFSVCYFPLICNLHLFCLVFIYFKSNILAYPTRYHLVVWMDRQMHGWTLYPKFLKGGYIILKCFGIITYRLKCLKLVNVIAHISIALFRLCHLFVVSVFYHICSAIFSGYPKIVTHCVCIFLFLI